jgi:hypothetical protein
MCAVRVGECCWVRSEWLTRSVVLAAECRRAALAHDSEAIWRARWSLRLLQQVCYGPHFLG